MRALPEKLKTMLSREATTMCIAWVIKRKDGRVIGLTDHDRPLVVDGVTCDPMDGADRSEIEARIGGNSDTGSLAGILSSDMIDDADIAAGRFDDAEIRQIAVNWDDPTVFAPLRTFRMGEITQGEGAYTVELRGASGVLSRPNGRVYSQTCHATFCDAACGLDRTQFIDSVQLIEIRSDRTIITSKPDPLAPASLANGMLRDPTNGESAVVLSAEQTSDGHLRLQLAQPFVGAAPGAQLEVTQGCDKSFATCRDRFANTPNFRGFPHMPGNHQILNYIDEETVFDGAPIVP